MLSKLFFYSYALTVVAFVAFAALKMTGLF